jgi:type I restriction enzyme S subunit
MSLPKYPKYKDSGVEWLGEVPEHWEVQPAKLLITSISGGGVIKGTCANEPEDNLYPGFSASGQDVWVENYDFDKPGIVLSAVGARCGKTFKADGKWAAVANTHCLFPTPRGDRDYLWYLTNKEDWWEKGGTAQPFVKVVETLSRKFVFPTPTEQHAIAAFLDRETAKIDALIAEQQRLIELLQEKRQAVISHAVTKGLNPDAPMKDSGIEWLGQVPEHWEVTSLKWLAILKSGESITADSIEESGSFPVFGGNGLRGFTEKFTHDGHFVVIGRQGALCGNVHYAKGRFWASEHAVVATPQCEIDVVWFGEMIRSMNLNQYSVTAAQPGLSMEFVGNLKTAVPPLHEQIAINKRVTHTTGRFDELISQSKEAITLLQERRSALISAAVTGQIDVRGLAPKEAA